MSIDIIIILIALVIRAVLKSRPRDEDEPRYVVRMVDNRTPKP